MLTDTKIAAIKPPATGQEEHPDHKVTGLRLRVGAGGKKTWTLRRRVGAKVINRKIGNYPGLGLAEARRAAEKMIEALEREGTTDAIDRTFGQVVEAWLERVAKPKNSSAALQERQLELHVLPHWRDRRIASIRRADVHELLDEIEGKVLPNRVLAIVKTVFRWAVSRDWIEFSPVEGVKKLRDEDARDHVLKMDEIAQLWGAAGVAGYPLGDFVRLLILTGQRRSEVAAMRWSDVDLDVGTWALPAADTKARRGHIVPLAPPAVEILKAVPRLGEYVFTTGKSHFSAFSKGKLKLDEYIAAKGGEMAPWRLHDLRRTASTEMGRLGIPQEVIGRVLNHAKEGVTAKVYALHSYAPEKRRALDLWAAGVLRSVTGKTADNVVQIHG